MVDQNSQFYAILTTVGAAKQANADALGLAWKITHLAVGDANGTEPTPNATQTRLINEWRRAPLNQLKVDDKDPSIIVAEQVIPADVGGKWIREIGLYDADGDLIAVANCAPTYKPLLSQGSGRTQIVRMSLIVSSAANVELKIDPSVVLATREWVTEELARQDFKHSVVVATTAGINLTGLQTIDGVVLTAGARVLVKNQASAKENGIYIVVSGGPWTRALDADSNAKVTPGLLVSVERGTLNGDSAWQLVTDGPISLGTTVLAFEMAFGRTGVTPNTYRSVQIDKYGRVVAATNPTTAAGYGITDVYTKDQTYSRQETASAISTAVDKAVAALVASSPEALDTLQELAAAINNDPNFANTMVKELAKKAGLDSPKFTGTPETPTPSPGSTGLQVANMAALVAAVGASARQFRAAVIGISANTTLIASQVGHAVQFNTGPVTLALPTVASVGNGASVMLRNASGTASQNIVVASSGSIVDAGSSVGAMSLKPMEWVELVSSGSSWFVVGRGKLKEVAELDSPGLTGTPTAPTAPIGLPSGQIANMAAVMAAFRAYGLGTAIGVTIPDFDDVSEAGLYRAEGSAKNSPFPNASMALLHIQFNQTGCLQLAGSCSSNIGNARLFWRTKAAGQWADWQAVARLDSPGFTGTPVAPTAALGTNSGQIATMAALLQAVNAYKRSYSGNVAGVGADITLKGSETGYAFNITAPVTVTLPTSADAGAGGTFVFRNVSSGVITIKTTTGRIFEKNNTVDSTTLQPGEWAELQASTTNYFINQRGSLNEIGSTVANALAQYGLGSTEGGKGLPGTTEGLANLASGNYYYPSAISPYPEYAFVQRMSYGGSRGFEVATIPYTDRLFLRGSNINGSWRSPVEFAPLNAPTFNGEVSVKADSALRIIGNAGKQGAIHRVDSNTYYILFTQSGDATGNWSSLRPFAIDYTSGMCSMRHGAVTATPDDSDDSTRIPTTMWVNKRVIQAAPPGQLAFFALKAPPAGWLKRNGMAVSRTTYAALFAAIGTDFGAGDGKTTFNLPDDRELIDRAWTDGANGADSGRALFSTQSGQNEAHAHFASASSAGAHQHNMTFVREKISSPFVEEGGNAVFGDQMSDGQQTLTSTLSGAHSHVITVNSAGGNETRMANRAYLACIKY